MSIGGSVNDISSGGKKGRPPQGAGGSLYTSIVAYRRDKKQTSLPYKASRERETERDGWSRPKKNQHHKKKKSGNLVAKLAHASELREFPAFRALRALHDVRQCHVNARGHRKRGLHSIL